MSLSRWMAVVCLSGWVAWANASPLTVRVTTISEQPDGHQFYMQVLEEALRLSGREYSIHVLPPVPQVRAQLYLESGTIDVFWMIRDAQRDLRYLPVDVRLNQGLIGHRILMIRPEDQVLFDSVTDLDSFRALGLTVGFGRGWIDSLVWAANDLLYFEEPGTWSVMFDKLVRGRGDFDYLSRSVKEITGELEQHPSLVAERNLVLAYDRDEAFYVTMQRTDLHDVLTVAMKQLEQSGRLQQLIDAYWGDVLEAVNFDARLLIPLKTP